MYKVLILISSTKGKGRQEPMSNSPVSTCQNPVPEVQLWLSPMRSSGKETAPLFSGTDAISMHSCPSLKSASHGGRGRKGIVEVGEEDGRRVVVGKKGMERKRREEKGSL